MNQRESHVHPGGGKRAAALIAALIVLAACGDGESPATPVSSTPKIAVSVFPLCNLTERLAGEDFEVQCVLPAGRDAHSYDPTPREVAALEGTDLVVIAGLGLDEWLRQVVNSATSEEVAALELGGLIETREVQAPEAGELEGHHHDHGHSHAAGAPDPHFWLDPRMIAEVLPTLRDTLAALKPEAREGLENRERELQTSLRALHREIADEAQTWTHRNIVTFHGSFGYFADRYNLNVAAVIEPFPGQEPSPRYLASVLSALENIEAPVVFSEPQLEARPARLVAEQSGRQMYELDPLGGTEGRDSYEALIRHNVSVLRRALE